MPKDAERSAPQRVDIVASVMNPITVLPTPPRRDRLIHEMRHDPYKCTRKLAEPTICRRCKAVFLRGRWQWADSWPYDSRETLCQACRRILDDYPAGLLTLTGAFVRDHPEEVFHLLRHKEHQETAAHPLHRIMALAHIGACFSVKTTDIHLPHHLGEALQRAYKGQLKIHYDREGYFARIDWHRD